MKISKVRLDLLVFQRGLSKSREQAKALILSGSVLVRGQRCDKAGICFPEDIQIALKAELHSFVSRGGIKLEAALKTFSVDVTEKIAIDVGASTGGFTDCLLRRGAARVYALDVGYGQLAWSLRTDPRVVVLERQNVRHLSAETIPEKVDVITIDASFISLEKVIPSIRPWLKSTGQLVALVKPQFEVGKGEVGKGGIVREEEKRDAVLLKICRLSKEWDLKTLGTMRSPIQGKKGNVEFLVCFGARPNTKNNDYSQNH